MNKFILFLPIFLLIYSCNSSLTGEGDANIAQDYQVEAFDAIEAKGKFKLILIPNDSSYISVQTHQNLLDNMDIYAQNKTLNIGEKTDVDSFESYVVYLYFDKQLDDIELHNKVYLESSEQLSFDKLEISANDETTVKQFAVDVKEMKIEANEKADVEITGSASTLDLKAKKYANVSLGDLKVKVMDVDMSGESEVLANVNKKLTGRVLENSTLTYVGSPQKDVEVKDNGEILNN